MVIKMLMCNEKYDTVIPTIPRAFNITLFNGLSYRPEAKLTPAAAPAAAQPPRQRAFLPTNQARPEPCCRASMLPALPLSHWEDDTGRKRAVGRGVKWRGGEISRDSGAGIEAP